MNRLEKLLGVEVPLLCGAMYPCSNWELVAAVRLRKIIANEWLLILAGIASVVFGIILLFQPAAGALALIWLIAAWAIISGVLFMILAFRMRNWKGFVTIRTAGA